MPLPPLPSAASRQIVFAEPKIGFLILLFLFGKTFRAGFIFNVRLQEWHPLFGTDQSQRRSQKGKPTNSTGKIWDRDCSPWLQVFWYKVVVHSLLIV